MGGLSLHHYILLWLSLPNCPCFLLPSLMLLWTYSMIFNRTSCQCRLHGDTMLYFGTILSSYKENIVLKGLYVHTAYIGNWTGSHTGKLQPPFYIPVLYKETCFAHTSDIYCLNQDEHVYLISSSLWQWILLVSHLEGYNKAICYSFSQSTKLLFWGVRILLVQLYGLHLALWEVETFLSISAYHFYCLSQYDQPKNVFIS